jgi:hypothetical protein
MEQGKNQPLGLYRHIETGTYIGATDETQANAFTERGYELVKEAHSVAEALEMSLEENLPSNKQEAPAPEDDKKGKK